MKINQSPIRFGFAILSLAGVLTACPSANTSGGGAGGGSGGGASLTLTGKIVNWPTSKTGLLFGVVGSAQQGTPTVATTPASINANGEFSGLAFPDAATIAPTLTGQGVAFFTCPSSSGTITGTAVAKLGFVLFLVRNEASANIGVVLEGTSNSTTPTVGDTQIFRIYSDANTLITGTCGSSTINVNLTVGWNIVLAQITAAGIGSLTSGTLPSNAKFYYFPNATAASKRGQFLPQEAADRSEYSSSDQLFAFRLSRP